MTHIRYLSGVANAKLAAVAHQHEIGLLATPLNGTRHKVDEYPTWAADNGCFAQGESFDLDRYYDWLVAIPAAQRETCRFAPAPDVVGDAVATLNRAPKALRRIRELGFPAALVAQDGLQDCFVPWRLFDVLFIGGSTEWKLGPEAAGLVAEAKARGKGVHMGRVNSYKRLSYAQSIGCDSADGTYLAYGPDKNLPKLVDWLERLAA